MTGTIKKDTIFVNTISTTSHNAVAVTPLGETPSKQQFIVMWSNGFIAASVFGAGVISAFSGTAPSISSNNGVYTLSHSSFIWSVMTIMSSEPFKYELV